MSEAGPYTTDTNDMRAVHAALGSAIGSAGPLVVGAGDDEAKVALVASYCEGVLGFLHVHHEGEDDLVYPILEQRCPDHAELLARVADQHALIIGPMDVAQGSLRAWRAAPGAASADALVAAMADVDEKMRPHFVEEEEEVLALASAYLSPDEWGALPGHALRSLGDNRPWLALGLVREGLTDEQRARQLAGMPPPLLQVWTDQWEPTFTSFIGAVRGIAPA